MMLTTGTIGEATSMTKIKTGYEIPRTGTGTVTVTGIEIGTTSAN
jgi:hypothetical protein